MPAQYRTGLARAAGRAVVDQLIAADWYPYLGCKLKVHEVGWDDIMNNEVAVYRAACGAFSKLREEGAWDLSTDQSA